MDFRRVLLGGCCRVLAHSGAGRLLAPWTQGEGLIFTLHSVLPARDKAEFTPNGHLTVTPEFLEATIVQVKAAGIEFVSLSEALSRIGATARGTRGGRRFAVLTFDDGYRNNLDHALPILQRHRVPATIFAATGFVDRTSEIWWEALERIIATADFIDMPIGARMERLPTRTRAEKYAVYSRAVSWLSRDMSEAAQRLEIRRMAAQHMLDLRALADELILSWDELRALSDDPLIEIGAHTHDHFALARLSSADIRETVQKGLERITAELGVVPRHFAYPYGYEAAVDRRSVDALSGFGFDCAVTTRPGTLDAGSGRDPLALPRISLNGYFQHPTIVGQYLTGAPFPLYNWARRFKEQFFRHRGGIRASSADGAL